MTVTCEASPFIPLSGRSSAITLAAGTAVNVGVQNCPGHPNDWVGLFPSTTPFRSFLNWFYLNGSKTPPGSGLTTATTPFGMPGTPVTYEFRFFSNNGYTRLAVSPTVTV